MNKIYILSTGRAGTSFLFNLLNKEFPELNISHQQTGSRIINILSNLPFKNEVYLNFLKKILSITGRGNPPSSTIDPLLTLSIAKLGAKQQLGNNFKIVHIVRDPRDFTTSFMNWKSSSFKRWFLHHIVPLWQPSPLLHGVSLINWLKMSKFEKFCWVWNYKNKLIYNTFKTNKNYRWFRVEDLTNSENPKENINKLFSFLELPNVSNLKKDYFNQKVNISKKKKFPEYKDWDEKKKKVIDKHCRTLMETFGYH